MTFAQPFHEYEILDRVGAGAMGTVFKARHKRLNRIVALKVLKPSLARDSRYVDRLKREARIVASLSHPNIVTGFDLGEEGGYHYFVMEFVEGKSLRALLVEWGVFAEEYVRRVARQVAQALDHAYQRGVIHRDIKPGNILIDEAGNVKLTDMGLAKGPADLTLTRDGATVGTPQYISPEQARNPHDVDVRTDLYSLGATLYHMVTGVPPFRGDTMAELITNVLHELPVSPKAINSALSEGMSLVIRKLLAKDLTVRYQTPRDLLEDLDRLEKSLPPKIDPQRLSAEERDRTRWLPRTLLATGVVVLLAAAWWLGLQARDVGEAPATAGEFLAALDAELARLPTPGARLLHLRTITAVPLGSEAEWQKRERAVADDLQRAVDTVVQEFGSDGGVTFAAWIHDPAVWPDRARVLRERLQPRLRERVGFSLAELAATVRMVKLEELQAEIDRALADRDRDLVVRFEGFLQHRVPMLAEEELRASDFAAAERVWKNGLKDFCNGTTVPLPERLSEGLRGQLQAMHFRAQQEALPQVEGAERAVEQAMRAEVAAACAGFTRQLGELPPDVVDAAVQRYRRAFAEHWPAGQRFRPGRSPWPDLDQELAALQIEVRAAVDRREEQRFAGRCALAWRSFCHGRAADALALLPDGAPAGSARAARVERHREVLLAAAAVEVALLQAIARASPAVVGFRRVGGAEALELRVDTGGGEARLVGASIGQPARPVLLCELRFGELLARLQQEQEPLAALAPEVRALGVAAYRLVGDELAGIGPMLAGLPAPHREFLADEVAPLVQRVREERLESPLDRERGFARLREARDAVGQGGALTDLEKALDLCRNLVPAHERSSAEEAELRAAEAMAQLARRRQRLLEDLAAAAPRGARIDVRAVGEQLVAEVQLGARELDAAEGWHLRGDALEFAGGGRKWAELEWQMLRGSAGIEARAMRSELTLDLVLPPATVGRRFWAFEFRGIACMLVLGANDTVHASLVDGDVRREDLAQKAFVRACSGVMGQAKAVAVPGGVHRLTLEVLPNSSRTSAMVRVLFDGCELFPPERRPLDPSRQPGFVVHPQQDLEVRGARVRAEGL